LGTNETFYLPSGKNFSLADLEPPFFFCTFTGFKRGFLPTGRFFSPSFHRRKRVVLHLFPSPLLRGFFFFPLRDAERDDDIIFSCWLRPRGGVPFPPPRRNVRSLPSPSLPSPFLKMGFWLDQTSAGTATAGACKFQEGSSPLSLSFLPAGARPFLEPCFFSPFRIEGERGFFSFEPFFPPTPTLGARCFLSPL